MDHNSGPESPPQPRPLSDAALYYVLEGPAGGDPSHGLRESSRYFSWAAAAIDPVGFIVVDSPGHLPRFEDVFLLATRTLREWVPDLAERLQELDRRVDLCQNVQRLAGVSNTPLINFRHPRGFLARFAAPEDGIALTLSTPERGEVPANRNMLVHVRGAIQRAAGITAAGAREAGEIWTDLKDTIVIENVYDPRRIARGILTLHLTAALNAWDNAPVPDAVKSPVAKQLREAISDVSRDKPPWNRVFSRISQIAIIVAGLTTFGAEVDDCYANIRKALNLMTETAAIRISDPADIPLLIQRPSDPASADSAAAPDG